MVALIAAFHRVLLNSCHAGFMLLSCQVTTNGPAGPIPTSCYCRRISTLPMRAFARGLILTRSPTFSGSRLRRGSWWDRRPHPPSDMTVLVVEDTSTA